MRLLSIALLLAFALPVTLSAQTTESDLKARLVNKPLYLRGMWSDDRLYFDATGQPSDESSPTPITLAGMNVKSVKLTPTGLILEGNRAGLTFEKDKPKRVNVRLNEGEHSSTHDRKMHVEIKPTASGDYTQPLNAIFTENIADLTHALPSYWQGFFDKHLPEVQSMSPIDYKQQKPNDPSPQPGLAKIGGTVSPPRVLHQPEPSFDDEARGTRLSGNVLIYLQVDKTGTPSHIRILRPLGLGLDERAVQAVSEYAFEPAKRDGAPVAVEMNVEVNFQIY